MKKSGQGKSDDGEISRRRSINADWRFFKYASALDADGLIYDARPVATDVNDSKDADSKPTEAVAVESPRDVLKKWILPSGNAFIADPAKRHARPEGNPGDDFKFTQSGFDDSDWQRVDLPHDWAIAGPFQTGWDSEVGGGMGRLPCNGVGWYRKTLDIPKADETKSIFLDVDGAMSYAIVWLNGALVGGWPYGYNSWRLDLTPFVRFGEKNLLAIRLDNPNNSARWYSGGGLYRDVWLTTVNPVHVAHWGTFVTAKDISRESATIGIAVTVENDSAAHAEAEIKISVYEIDDHGRVGETAITGFTRRLATIAPRGSARVDGEAIIANPKLWGPPPTQKPNRYVAVTTVSVAGREEDRYETKFGIRDITVKADAGFLVNGELVKIHGVNQHHDLGALGAAFNVRAAERQLETLREMGCNAIRLAHNPPAPGLLELTDRMGFLVVDEIFDSWERKKTPHDFHLIFPDWHEQDARALIRRDRNHPSVFLWSFGNEVGEQYTGEEGAAIARRLREIFREEDPTRLTTTAMNYAKPDMALPDVPDVIGLNYQGEGIRQDPEFEGTDRIRTPPQYPAFHEHFPEKAVIGTETASAFSTRGEYLFPVSPALSAPVRDGRGGNSTTCQVSAYELHAVDFGSTADKVFGSLARHPFVAGEFVWTGWDHIGEPTPYYEARSAYCGIVDLAGFPKDRFWLYQSQWRPELPMIHVLPHWTWPERVGEITPVHVFTSGDEAELFLNGKSLGRKKKGPYEYRLRWDDAVYEPGELRAVARRDGERWAETVVRTAGAAARLVATADRPIIAADGKDLAFITVRVCDAEGLVAPRAKNAIEFTIAGPGEILATDNGDPTDMISFKSTARCAFNGLCLAIVRFKPETAGTITVTIRSPGLEATSVTVTGR